MNLMQELKSRLDDAKLWQKDIALKRNDYLKLGGSRDTNLYFVDEGSLRIFIQDEKEELTIRFGYSGDFIASLDSFISEGSSEYFIQALKKSRVKCIGKEAYMKFISSSDQNIRLWNDLLLLLVQMHLEREKDILTSSPLLRYQRVLKRSPRLFQEIPHKYISSYLRMSPETLSRLKKS